MVASEISIRGPGASGISTAQVADGALVTRVVVPGGIQTGTGTVNTAADHTVVAAPGAGKRLLLRQVKVQNEGATPVAVDIKAGATVLAHKLLAQYDELVFDLGGFYPLPANTALVVTLGGAETHNWFAAWVEEAV